MSSLDQDDDDDALVRAVRGDLDEHIPLNVGGTQFEALAGTLTLRCAYFRNALWAKGAGGDSNTIPNVRVHTALRASPRPARTPLFIDRDPRLFRHVLALLRDPEWRPDADPELQTPWGRRNLRAELEFFRVDADLVSAVMATCVEAAAAPLPVTLLVTAYVQDLALAQHAPIQIIWFRAIDRDRPFRVAAAPCNVPLCAGRALDQRLDGRIMCSRLSYEVLYYYNDASPPVCGSTEFVSLVMRILAPCPAALIAVDRGAVREHSGLTCLVESVALFEVKVGAGEVRWV